MRILCTTPLYWPYIGGMESATMALLAELRDRGHDACVVTSHDVLDLSDEEEHDGIPIHRLPLRAALSARDPGLLLTCQRRAANQRRAFAPDVVHVNLPDPGAAIHLRAAAAHPGPMLVAVHAFIPLGEDGRLDTLFGTLMRTAQQVVAPSKAILDPLRAAVPGLDERSSVIPNGLPAAEASVKRATQPQVLCVGRLIPEKGFDVAIAAFASVASRFPNARLIIAGDGSERERLVEQARHLAIGDRVDFLGWVPPERIPAVIGASSVVAIPSRCQDAFPTVALEAAWQGRPVVAARIGGLVESVVDGETGFVVEPDDSAALAGALTTLLEDAGLAARMGDAARTRAVNQYGVGRCADDYERLYEQLTKTRMHAGTR